MVNRRQLFSEQYGKANQGWLRVLLLLVCVSVAVMAGYAAGLADQNGRFSMVETANNELLEEVANLRDQQHQARLKLARLESGRVMDAQAMREARATIVSLETRVSELESDLGFYRNIMSPSETEKGFQLDRFSVKATEQNRVFDYALVVIQIGNNERFLSGRIAVTITGVKNGKLVEFGLRELSGDGDEGDIKYRFRYFQDIVGRLMLPEGFRPERVRLVARAPNREKPVLEEAWSWSDLVVRESPNS